MFILKKGHQPGVYVPLRALFLVFEVHILTTTSESIHTWTIVHSMTLDPRVHVQGWAGGQLLAHI